VKYSIKWIIKYGICSGTGLKEDIPINPRTGLSENTGILQGKGIGYFLRERNS
jgi:hypothetical protein